MKKTGFTILFFLLSIIPSIILTPRLLLRDPPIWLDEVYFVSMAERYNDTGYISVPLFGTNLSESLHIRAYNYPPVYIYILAFWIKLFENSITTIRLLSTFIGLASLVLFYRLILKATNSHRYSIAGTLTLQLFPPFSMAIHIARMEILVFFFFLASISEVFGTKRKTIFTIAIATLYSMLAFLSHPIGIVVPLFVFISLAISSENFRKKLIQLGTFCCIVGLGLFWWFWQIHDHVDLFVKQISSLVSYKVAREPLINLLFEHDLIWRCMLLTYLALGCFGIIQGITHKKYLLLLSGIGVFLTLFITIYGVDQWYFILLPIFPVLLSITGFRRSFIAPLLVLLTLHSAGSIPAAISHFERNENYQTFSEGISKEIPSGNIVIISTIPDPYFILKNRKDITLYEMPVLVNKSELETFVSHADIIVYNYALNSALLPYISAHTLKKVTVRQINGYETDVIFLSH